MLRVMAKIGLKLKAITSKPNGITDQSGSVLLLNKTPSVLRLTNLFSVLIKKLSGGSCYFNFEPADGNIWRR